MFGRITANGFGALAALHLAIQRGDADRPVPVVLPHHQDCPVCGFDRWDGRTDHSRMGVRFAAICTGVLPDKSAPRSLVDELLASVEPLS